MEGLTVALGKGRAWAKSRKPAKTPHIPRTWGPGEWRSGNLWGPSGDGVRWRAAMHAARLEWGAHFTTTPTARRRLLRWGVDRYELHIARSGAPDWAVAGSNRCYARLRET